MLSVLYIRFLASLQGLNPEVLSFEIRNIFCEIVRLHGLQSLAIVIMKRTQRSGFDEHRQSSISLMRINLLPPRQLATLSGCHRRLQQPHIGRLWQVASAGATTSCTRSRIGFVLNYTLKQAQKHGIHTRLLNYVRFPMSSNTRTLRSIRLHFRDRPGWGTSSVHPIWIRVAAILNAKGAEFEGWEYTSVQCSSLQTLARKDNTLQKQLVLG